MDIQFRQFRSPKELSDWFEERADVLQKASTNAFCCFGSVYRINSNGDYVSEERFYDTLPTETDRNLWLCMANGASPEKLLPHIQEGEWLKAAASDSIDLDGPAFYTLVLETDYTDSELESIAASRPELFDSKGNALYGDPVFRKTSALGSSL